MVTHIVTFYVKCHMQLVLTGKMSLLILNIKIRTYALLFTSIVVVHTANCSKSTRLFKISFGWHRPLFWVSKTCHKYEKHLSYQYSSRTFHRKNIFCHNLYLCHSLMLFFKIIFCTWPGMTNCLYIFSIK